MKLFLQVIKDVGVSGVHVTTTIGNTKKKPLSFNAAITGVSVVEPDEDDEGVAKSAWTLPMQIKKIDPDKQLIFGWASVVEKDGKVVVDKQGDIIPVEELENAAYEYVVSSRDGGDMHVQRGVAGLVESMVFTIEKQKVLGIDLGQVGWWTGFRVSDSGLWEAHKRGERPEFSIGGAAVPVEIL